MVPEAVVEEQQQQQQQQEQQLAAPQPVGEPGAASVPVGYSMAAAGLGAEAEEEDYDC